MIYYMSIPEAAVLWNTFPKALRKECEINHNLGAVRFGYRWMIPVDAKCPLNIAHNRHSQHKT